MFDNVMVGIDERDGGRDAIALARELVSDEGKLTLAYVHGGFPIAARGSGEFEASEKDRAMTVLRDERDRAGIAGAALESIGATSVGRGLHELAQRIGADLLVVGSTRRGMLGRVLVGDDTSASLNGAPCAVAIAPAGYEQHPRAMREIGVGYNGSAESEHAIKVAKELAARHGATVSAFEAVLLPPYTFWGVPVPTEESVKEMIADATKRIEAVGVVPHSVYGLAAEELALYSASVSLLVLGSRDYGPFGRLMHGSTSHALARSARCPLLILTKAARTVRRGADDPSVAAVATA